MSFFPKTLNIFIMMVLLAITGYIIFRTVSDVGLILYTLHPVLISFGVSKKKLKQVLEFRTFDLFRFSI